MPSLIQYLAFATILLQLIACSGGGSSSLDTSENERFSLSGTIQIAAGVQVDSDSNDINAPFTPNNAITTAQEIDSLVLLSGFVAKTPTGVDNQRFTDKADETDVFKAKLIAGQVITLIISKWDKKSELGQAPDLDLSIFDTNGNSLAVSNGASSIESITISENGTYYIQVKAFSGFSGYLLAIDQSNAVVANQSQSTTAKDTMILGQAVVKYRESAELDPQVGGDAKAQLNTSPSRKTLFRAHGLHSNHYQANRAALVTFDSEQMTPSAIAALSASSVFSSRSTFSTPSSLSTQSIKPKESEFRRELAQMYPELYQQLKTYDVIKSLNQRDDVEYAEPNYLRHAMLVPNDRGYASQWHYPLINLPKAWDITTGTPAKGKVIVAVIDSGILPNHPDLKNQLVPGYDFLEDLSKSNDGNGIDSDPTDPGDGDSTKNQVNTWHGSHVAGTIAAQTDNRIGIAGVSWGAKIMPIRALGVGGGTSYAIAQSILFASRLKNDSGILPEQRADIINMSLGGEGISRAEREAIEKAHNAGVILVAAAGNESTTSPVYPAAFPHVISVSAIASDGLFASNYSNSGPTIDIAAPGGNIIQDLDDDGYVDGVLSTIQSNQTGTAAYAFYEGTSMATPHVSGVIALMKAVNPNLTPDDIDSALASGELTVDAGIIGRDDLYGYGIIDAYKAVSYAKNGSLPDVVMLPSSEALQFASFQQSKELDLINIGRLGNSNQITVTSIEGSTSWLNIVPIANNDRSLARFRFDVDPENLGLGAYETIVTFRFANQGISLETSVTVKVTMYVGLVETVPNAGPLYVIARQEESTESDAFSSEVVVEAEEGEYRYKFTNLKKGTYYIYAGADSDSDFILFDEHDASGAYPTSTRPLTINLNRDTTNLNFSVSTSRSIDLNSLVNQFNTRQSDDIGLKP